MTPADEGIAAAIRDDRISATVYHSEVAEEMQVFPTDLLIAIAKGEFDMAKIAKDVVVGRGLGRRGNWVGFPEAKVEWNA